MQKLKKAIKQRIQNIFKQMKGIAIYKFILSKNNNNEICLIRRFTKPSISQKPYFNQEIKIKIQNYKKKTIKSKINKKSKSKKDKHKNYQNQMPQQDY